MFCVLLYGIVTFLVRAARCAGDENILGPGMWEVIGIQRCENHEEYSMDIDVSRERYNRTTVVFNALLNLIEGLDDSFAMRAEIRKKTDSGWKDFHLITDNSMCAFAKKFSEENFVAILTNAKVDPPDCPIKPGKYDINEYAFDFKKLPKEAHYGEFQGKIFLISEYGQDMACVEIISKFERQDED